jgi:hypothetical protein
MSRWADIPGWEGRYEVSDDGRVRSLVGRCSNPVIPHELKQKIDRYGYPVVCLHCGQIKRFPPVHRLVALAFLPNSDNKPQVNHKNGIKTDNRIENLEWSTNSENIRHAFDTGLISKENVCAGQKRRYERVEERMASSSRMKAKYANADYAARMKDNHQTPEHRALMSELRSKQEPPTKGRKRINNGAKEKMVLVAELDDYLRSGWVLGRIFHKRSGK